MPLLIGLCLLLLAGPALADVKPVRFSCAGADVTVEGAYDPSYGRPTGFSKFDMTVSRGNGRVHLDLGYGYMHAACLKDSQGQELIVFQQYCDGSGCQDLDNYGIVDPRTLTVLLMPSDTNRRAAGRILRQRHPPRLFRHPDAVCCEH